VSTWIFKINPFIHVLISRWLLSAKGGLMMGTINVGTLSSRQKRKTSYFVVNILHCELKNLIRLKAA